MSPSFMNWRRSEAIGFILHLKSLSLFKHH
jgi:hypothetical protein